MNAKESAQGNGENGKEMTIEKILLIVPPDTRPADMSSDKVRIGLVAPLGLGYIGATLEQNGYDVKILDCVANGQREGLTLGNGEIRYGMTDKQIQDAVTNYQPDVVGVSCLFSNRAQDAHNACRLVKDLSHGIFTIMGGSHPSAMPEETLEDANVNAVIMGDGELAMLDALKRIPDFAWKWGRGNPENLDELPFPARHLLNMPVYLSGESAHSGHKATPAANITTSRGCPSSCAFCAIRCTFGDKYRGRSLGNVLAEIDQLVTDYKIKELDIEDDNFTANKARAKVILQGIIDRKYNLALNSPSGLAIFAMDEELLDKMVEAGYYSVSFAIESGVPWVLRDLMHKAVDLDKAKRLVKYGRSIGLKVKAFFILGYPGETKDTMERTVDFAGELGADWSLFFPATALPGTDLDFECRRNHWLIDPDMDLRYNFFKSNIRTAEFDPDFVLDLKERANQELNFEGNINIREGKLDRAKEDIGEVVKLYPKLDFARKALALCK